MLSLQNLLFIYGLLIILFTKTDLRIAGSLCYLYLITVHKGTKDMSQSVSTLNSTTEEPAAIDLASKATVLYYTLLYYTVLYSTVLYSTVLFSTMLYSTVLFSTVLYPTML